MAATERSSSGTILRSLSPSSPRFHQRSVSPTRLNHTLRFPLEYRSISSGGRESVVVSGQKTTCLCSPTTHPGSFRCARHRRSGSGKDESLMRARREFWTSNGLNLRRSAMVNSLARIGGVEGELAKSISAALVRPSFHHLHRRTEFRPRPSRFYVMCNDQGS